MYSYLFYNGTALSQSEVRIFVMYITNTVKTVCNSRIVGKHTHLNALHNIRVWTVMVLLRFSFW